MTRVRAVVGSDFAEIPSGESDARTLHCVGRSRSGKRAVLLLKELEGWSVAEIAAAMRWKEKRVYNELYRARLTLAEWRRREAGEGDER